MPGAPRLGPITVERYSKTLSASVRYYCFVLLPARPRRRGLPKDTGGRAAVPGKLLDRAFEASASNQKWVAGFTYIWSAEGWLRVAAIVDLFSRRGVSRPTKARKTPELVTDALIMATWRRGRPDGLLHHGDRGSQYTRAVPASDGRSRITCSMSRSGNVWGNAAKESFLSSRETERTARRIWRARDAAWVKVLDYIKRFYETVRLYSIIGVIGPVEFER